MKSLTKILWLLPLFLIFFQIFFYSLNNHQTKLSPQSNKNNFHNELLKILNTAKIEPLHLTIHEYSNEIVFHIKNDDQHTYKVHLSSDKSILTQVNALQKLIKIANIKEKDIQFIDLGSQRPYATL